MAFEEWGPKQSLQTRLRENRLGWRLALGLLFTLVLAAFLHFREIKVEVLELDAIAGRYVVSQVDFEFLDPEATIILKQEAIRGIGRIFKLDEKQIRQIRYEFESSLIKEERVEGLNFQEIYTAADLLEEVLLDSRFTDSKTLQRLKDLHFSTDFYQIFTPTSVEEPVLLPRQYWRSFSEGAEQLQQVSSKAIDLVIRFFQAKKWKFLADVETYTKLTKMVQGQVPEKLTRINAGTRIIDQGEKVTSRHILMLQAMKKALGESRNIWQPLPLLASLMMSSIFVILSAAYFYYNQREIIQSLQKLSLLLTIVVLTLIFSKTVEYALINTTTSFFDFIRYPIFIPFATILICILLDARIALFTAAFLAIILAVTLALDHARFLVLNLVSALVIIIAARGLHKRKEVFGVCGKAFASTLPILFAFSFVGNEIWSLFLLGDILSSLLFFLVTAIFVVGLLPLLESLFKVMTDMSLMEFMDPSNELLRRMMLEAPGTYQHSLVLGNLAEACATAINANGLFCRVATLYHDVGKLSNPHFFTENQQGGMNIHQLLTPLESAKVIISHVTDGEMLAKKYRLPRPFIDIIREHHGTTLAYYFYAKEVELKGGKKEEVDQELFRYPGPRPKSKESAIIMITDTVEAASRSVENITEESLIALIDRLISSKEEDGQFDECSLTFEELSIVKRTLAKNLLLSHHVRIKYPQKK